MPSADNHHYESHSWLRKFTDAARGVKVAVRAEVSFFVHLFVTVLVVMLGLSLGLPKLSWCVLAICITGVLTAELFNSSIERLARAITQETNPEIRDALDMASGAVLVASIGSVVVGLVVLALPLWDRMAG
ncbi:diacylglycerol kinase [Adhaeretor mobilis]|uniref:Undecaprenol kinase n=1 Tax=Adhaeretor mobilis TaxID=1930276 RepID=A0A517N1R7_9BACT|nr:diacylglycerol kinase [Adhaeretor mobilis]QDT01084.1 Undecaprenol kinase [Adhaeretor mobilis]